MEPNEDFHPAVQFLLARIKSHPEDFAPVTEGAISSARRGAWSMMYTRIEFDASETEKAAMDRAVRSIRLDNCHQDAMKLALNPPIEKHTGITATERYAYGFADPRAVYGSGSGAGHITTGTGGGSASSTFVSASYDPHSDIYRVNGGAYTASQLDDMGVLERVEQSIRAQQTAYTTTAAVPNTTTTRVSTYDALKNFIAGSK
jgi:hypothetical protein